eukprot:6940187-Prymnesium_polylepis.1
MSAGVATAAAGELVEEAIARAQDAVNFDTNGEFERAIELYKISVDLIKRAMQKQRGDEGIDSGVLQRYLQLYSDRISKLQEHVGSGAAAAEAEGDAPSADGGVGTSGTFSFADMEEISQRTPPSAAPSDEWRRTFWLMRILRSSMHRGGFISPDGRVYVPKRLW